MRSSASLGDMPSTMHATALICTERREPTWQKEGQKRKWSINLHSVPTILPHRTAFPHVDSVTAWSSTPPAPLPPHLLSIFLTPLWAYLCEASGASVGNAGSCAPWAAQQPCQKASQPFHAEAPVAGMGRQHRGSQQPPTEHVAAHRVHAAADGHGNAHCQRPGREQRPPPLTYSRGRKVIDALAKDR